MKHSMIALILVVTSILTGCQNELAEQPPLNLQELQVTATAYTSSPGQTDDTPNIAAWGDVLEPGMKAIAVSRDLLQLGLKHGDKVRIEGLDGEFTVLDKMNKRWERKIDIYMGESLEDAKDWGKQQVTIVWDMEES